MTPKKTCEEFGLESVIEMAQATGKPARTIAHWFNSEPALFQALLTGVAVQKLAAESGYGSHEALEILKLGIQVKRDAEAIVKAVRLPLEQVETHRINSDWLLDAVMKKLLTPHNGRGCIGQGCLFCEEEDAEPY